MRTFRFSLSFLALLAAFSLSARTPRSSALSTASRLTVIATDPADSRLRLTPVVVDSLAFSPLTSATMPSEGEVSFTVLPSHTRQQILGFGAALTDATLLNAATLSPRDSARFLSLYYDARHGLGYTLLRLPMGSCDFSLSDYDYLAPGDTTLRSFDISPDKPRFPYLREAFRLVPDLKVYVSPWSPPAWMKSNADRSHGGTLLPRYAPLWAQCYVRYIRALEGEGFPVWGLTVQNEPLAVQRWESCIYTADAERDFVRDHLGPALRRAGMRSKRLIVWDHNRDLLFHRAATILADPRAARYVWGVGFHWYEVWAGAGENFEAPRMVHETFPDKTLVFTEGCPEGFRSDEMGSYRLGERYAHNILSDLRSGLSAWTDWNMLLDAHGGPNHADNLCFAPLHVVDGQIFFTFAYYYIGHFSRYIRPGAVALASCSSSRNLEAVAFRNPDGEVVVVALNRTDSPLPFRLIFPEVHAAVTLPPHTIQTYLIRP